MNKKKMLLGLCLMHLMNYALGTDSITENIKGWFGSLYTQQKTGQKQSPQEVVKLAQQTQQENAIRFAIMCSCIGDALARPILAINLKNRESESKKNKKLTVEELYQTFLDNYNQGIISFTNFKNNDFTLDSAGKKVAPITAASITSFIALNILNNYSNKLESSQFDSIMNDLVGELKGDFLQWQQRFPDDIMVKILNAKKGLNWHENKGMQDSWGPLMLASPQGILLHKEWTRAAIFSAKQAEIITGNKAVKASCAALATGVAHVIQGAMSTKIVTVMYKAAKHYDAATAALIVKMVDRAKSLAKDINEQGKLNKQDLLNRSKAIYFEQQGWTSHSALAAALYSFVLVSQLTNISSFDRIILALYVSINTPGNSCAIAAITGTLVGAYYGRLLNKDQQVKIVELFKKVEYANSINLLIDETLTHLFTKPITIHKLSPEIAAPIKEKAMPIKAKESARQEQKLNQRQQEQQKVLREVQRIREEKKLQEEKFKAEEKRKEERAEIKKGYEALTEKLNKLEQEEETEAKARQKNKKPIETFEQEIKTAKEYALKQEKEKEQAKTTTNIPELKKYKIEEQKKLDAKRPINDVIDKLLQDLRQIDQDLSKQKQPTTISLYLTYLKNRFLNQLKRILDDVQTQQLSVTDPILEDAYTKLFQSLQRLILILEENLSNAKELYENLTTLLKSSSYIMPELQPVIEKLINDLNQIGGFSMGQKIKQGVTSFFK